MLDMQIFLTMTNYTIYGFPEKTILTLLNILALKFFWETLVVIPPHLEYKGMPPAGVL
jgi:hypothetical protein